MKKIVFILMVALLGGNMLMAQTKPAKKEAVTYPIPMKKQKAERGNKVYDVADIYDVARIYRPEANPAQCFFVISKQEFRLYVYEVEGKDTLLAAHFPICYAKNPGPKTRTGDMSTPECSLQHPATISQIRNSSSWAHDFKDGRGSFPAYGAWFMRLDLSKSDCHPGCRSNKSIGIHGSSGNRLSVPGRDSEGCIRLRDEDIKTLKSRFTIVGTRVVIKSANAGKLPFELRAEKNCKDYQRPEKGYRPVDAK